MSQEIHTPPRVAHEGMTPQQEQTAIQLRQNSIEKSIALDSIKDRLNFYTYGFRTRSNGEYVKPSYAVRDADRIEQAFTKYQFKRAQKKAARHYKQNELAYQEQAHKEATETGVVLNDWPKE